MVNGKVTECCLFACYDIIRKVCLRLPLSEVEHRKPVCNECRMVYGLPVRYPLYSGERMHQEIGMRVIGESAVSGEIKTNGSSGHKYLKSKEVKRRRRPTGVDDGQCHIEPVLRSRAHPAGEKVVGLAKRHHIITVADPPHVHALTVQPLVRDMRVAECCKGARTLLMVGTKHPAIVVLLYHVEDESRVYTPHTRHVGLSHPVRVPHWSPDPQSYRYPNTLHLVPTLDGIGEIEATHVPVPNVIDTSIHNILYVDSV